MVEDVDEFSFFHGGDHDGTSFGIGTQVLSWGSPTALRLSKGNDGGHVLAAAAAAVVVVDGLKHRICYHLLERDPSKWMK